MGDVQVAYSVSIQIRSLWVNFCIVPFKSSDFAIFFFFLHHHLEGNEGLQCINNVCYSFSFSGTSCELFPYLRSIISGMTLRVVSGCLVMTTKCTHLTTLRNVAADAVFCEDGCCWSTGRRRF